MQCNEACAERAVYGGPGTAPSLTRVCVEVAEHSIQGGHRQLMLAAVACMCSACIRGRLEEMRKVWEGVDDTQRAADIPHGGICAAQVH